MNVNLSIPPTPVSLENPPGVREAARLLERSFIEEMLKYSGVGQVPDDFGGGDGESQFASLLVSEYAEMISDAGGIGLREALFRVMTRGGR